MFGDEWKTFSMSKENILKNANEIHKREGEVGYSTNGWKVLDWAIKKGIVFDRIMMFTDNQMWNSNVSKERSFKTLWSQYKEMAPNCKMTLFDLAGHGTTPLRVEQNDVYLISGWSNEIFKVLEAIENGAEALSRIDEIVL